jgi:hypothetical protein
MNAFGESVGTFKKICGPFETTTQSSSMNVSLQIGDLGLDKFMRSRVELLMDTNLVLLKEY